MSAPQLPLPQDPNPGRMPAPPAAEPSRPFPWGRIVGLVVILLITGGLYYWWQARQASEAAQATAFAVRSGTASAGRVQATVRLTGVTAAERFVSLIAPQMRGSRGGFGRGDSAVQPAQASAPVGSKYTQTSAGSSSSRGAMSSSMQAATGRSSSGSGGGTSGNTPISNVSAGNSMGGSGLGTTGGQFAENARMMQAMSSGGGPGGGGDFQLVLQQLAKPGSMVRKGDSVAEFDRQYMLTRLDDYRAAVVQSEMGQKRRLAYLEITRENYNQKIRQAKADLDKAKLDLKTIPVLGTIEAERLRLAAEAAESRYKQYLAEAKFVETSEQAQIKISEIDMEQTRAELKRAEANADRMILKAPIDGLTVMQNMPRGGEFSQIQQGDQLFPGQFFMQIVDPASMVVNASVNQVDAERLRIGARARVRFDAFPGLELPARVYSVAGIAKTGGSRGQYVKELPVRLKLEKMDPRVIPDLSVGVDVIIDEDEAQVKVSRAAVFQDEPGRPFVFVETAKGWEKRPVELGAASFVEVAIRNGLRAGEKVALERPGATAPVQRAGN